MTARYPLYIAFLLLSLFDCTMWCVSVGQVVKKEGLKASMPTLMALCEKADNEVRTCLNSIQVHSICVESLYQVDRFCIVLCASTQSGVIITQRVSP